MNLVFRAIQSLREQGVRATLDSGLWILVHALRNRFYRFKQYDYGLVEAVLWPWAIDVWHRNAIVIDSLRRHGANSKTTVLDVGAGGEGIRKVMQYSDLEVDSIVQLDIDPSVVSLAEGGYPVIGDGCRLPFEDNSFDFVVSVDSLEHIPADRRGAYISEAKRVAEDALVFHFPINSDDNEFVGRRSDEQFQEWHVEYQGHPESNTVEHLEGGYPTVEELTDHFDEEHITGVQNEGVWFRYMTLGRRPVLRALTGLYYYLFLKARDNRPPYHGCLIDYPIADE